MLLFMFFVSGLMYFYLAVLKRNGNKAEAGLVATDLYYALEHRLYEMMEDPAVSDRDWLEMLPICQYTEKYWLEVHPYCDSPPGSLVGLVENQLV